MLAEINISYLSVNLSSTERPKVISILGNVLVQILTLYFAGVFYNETISILFEVQLF